MEIQDLFRVIWRKKWIIIFVPIFTCLLAIQFLSNKEDSYKSKAKIATGFTDVNAVGLSNETTLIKDAEIQFSNLLDVMNSSVVFNLVSYRLLLNDLDTTHQNFRVPADVSLRYEENPLLRFKGFVVNNVVNLVSNSRDMRDENLYTLNTAEEIASVQQMVLDRYSNMKPLNPDDQDFPLIRKFYLEFGYSYTDIRNNLTIKRLSDSDFILVEFLSENPELSAYVANAYCEEFIRYYNSLKSETSLESVAFLERAAEEKREILDGKFAELKGFKSSENIHESEEAGSSRMFQLVSLENLRVEILATIQRLDLTINRLRTDAESLNKPNAENREIVELQEKIKKLNAQYLLGSSTDKPMLDSLTRMQTKLRGLVSNLEDGISPIGSAQEVEERLKDATIEKEVENNRILMVESKINGLKYGLSNLNSNEGKVTAIQNEIDVATAEYVVTVNKYNEARNRQVSGSPVRQILKASPAITPSSTKKIYLVGGALVSSLAFVLFIIIMQEVTDHSIRTPSRFNQIVQLPLTGTLNRLKFKEPLNLPDLFADTSTDKNDELFKSSLRKLRHQIEALDAKVILFTSARSGAGKSFVIFTLSYAMSLVNKKVLIIDTNFSNRTLTLLYGQGLKEIKVLRRNMVPARPQLAEVTTNGALKKEEENHRINFNDLVNPTKQKNIFFVGNTGILNSSPAELLSDKDFNKFLSIMAARFDYIFLEGASFKDYSDSKELVGFVDKVVTVFSADMTLQPVDGVTTQFIRSLNGKSGGTILNNVDARDMNL